MTQLGLRPRPHQDGFVSANTFGSAGFAAAAAASAATTRIFILLSMMERGIPFYGGCCWCDCVWFFFLQRNAVIIIVDKEPPKPSPVRPHTARVSNDYLYTRVQNRRQTRRWTRPTMRPRSPSRAGCVFVVVSLLSLCCSGGGVRAKPKGSVSTPAKSRKAKGLLTPAPAPPRHPKGGGGCRSTADCHHVGRCTGGSVLRSDGTTTFKCACNPGWTGYHCERAPGNYMPQRWRTRHTAPYSGVYAADERFHFLHISKCAGASFIKQAHAMLGPLVGGCEHVQHPPPPPPPLPTHPPSSQSPCPYRSICEPIAVHRQGAQCAVRPTAADKVRAVTRGRTRGGVCVRVGASVGASIGACGRCALIGLWLRHHTSRRRSQIADSTRKGRKGSRTRCRTRHPHPCGTHTASTLCHTCRAHLCTSGVVTQCRLSSVVNRFAMNRTNSRANWNMMTMLRSPRGHVLSQFVPLGLSTVQPLGIALSCCMCACVSLPVPLAAPACLSVCSVLSISHTLACPCWPVRFPNETTSRASAQPRQHPRANRSCCSSAYAACARCLVLL